MEIKYLIVDVDGTLTDGSIYYDDFGNELKKFNTKDAAGFFCAKEAGLKTIVFTGRECKATRRRMEEMKVDYLFQNVKNKAFALKQFIEQQEIDPEEIAYVGDDLNDYSAMRMVGFRACPFDAAQEIKDISDYVSGTIGGQGVLRDVVRKILTDKGIYEICVKKAYNLE